MALAPAAFTASLLEEARATHPWLHHPLFQLIYDGRLERSRLQRVIRQQGCFFLDTLRHAAWKIISVGGYTPTWEDLERQRALIPLVVEEGGEDTVGGKTTAHAFLYVRLCEGLGIAREEVFGTEYLPTTVIEKDELFLLQRSSPLEALCGGNIATESINPIHMQRMADAMETHYGVARDALDFYYVHVAVEADHADRAVRILSKLAVTDEEQARGRLALRRAIAARRICADGMLAAFVGPSREKGREV
jgi:pyrroloquinoline quinone (PQQ) biosynthesis protein C